MIIRHVMPVLAAIILIGCSGPETPIDNGNQPEPAAVARTDAPQRETHHDAERVALEFITSIRNSEYRTDIPDIPVDADLSSQERARVFRLLERFIKSQEWHLWFTSIDVFEGNEDSVDCYLRGADGGLLVLLLGYHYDIREWRIDAYEMPELTFARPEGESYAAYVARSVAESKHGAKPYNDGVDGDGPYFIEY